MRCCGRMKVPRRGIDLGWMVIESARKTESSWSRMHMYVPTFGFSASTLADQKQ